MANVQINDLASVTPADDTSLIVQTAAGTTGKSTPAAVCGAGAVYGHMYYSNSTGTNLVLTAQNTWYGVTFLTAGEVQGMTADAADATADHLTISTTGVYRMTFTASADPDAAGTFEIGIHVNGTACSRGGIAIVSPSVSDSISKAGHSIVRLTAGQEISFRARCTSAATKTLKFFVVSLSVERLGA